MYTEVGEQMAEQNILNGNQKKLEQIIGDVKEHNTKKDRLEKLAESVKDISKELDNARKEKQNEHILNCSFSIIYWNCNC